MTPPTGAPHAADPTASTAGVRSTLRAVTRPVPIVAAAAIDAALRGHGVICARSYQVAEHLAAGRLVRLLPELEPPVIPAHLVFSPERAKGGALRAFIDHAVPTLQRELMRIETTIQVS